MQNEFTIAADSNSHKRFESTLLNNQHESNADATLGQIDWIGENGEVKKSWQIECEAVTIGSNDGCSVVIPASGLEVIHIAITFGRNHILIQAIEGEVKISGRQIGEWLIDEPTYVQLGAAKIQVIPASFMKKQFASHQLTPGDVADQAARLQSLANLDTSEIDAAGEAEVENATVEVCNADVLAIETPPTMLASPEPIPSTVPNFNVAEVANEMKAAIEPLRDSLDAIRSSVIEGLRDLSTNLAERYEQRFQDTSAVIDSRFERLENLLVSSQSTLRYAETRSEPTQYVEPQYVEPQYETTQHETTQHVTDQYVTDQYQQSVFKEEYGNDVSSNENAYQAPEATSTAESYESPAIQSPQYFDSLNAQIFEDPQLAIETPIPVRDGDYFGTPYSQEPSDIRPEIDEFTNQNLNLKPDQYLPAEIPEPYEFQSEKVGYDQAVGEVHSETPHELASLLSPEVDYSAEPQHAFQQVPQQTFAEESSTYHDSRFGIDDLDVISEVDSHAVESNVRFDDLIADDLNAFASDLPNRDSDPELPAWFTASSSEDSESDVPYADHSVAEMTGVGFESQAVENSEESIEAYATGLLEGLGYTHSGESQLDSKSATRANHLEDYSQDIATASDEPPQYEEDDSQLSYAEEIVESNRPESNQDLSESTGDDEEESIEVYMQRLLQRAKGGGDSEVSIASTLSSGKEKPVPQKAAIHTPEPIEPAKPIQTRPEPQQVESESGTEFKHYGAIPSTPDEQTAMTRQVPRVSVEQQQQSLVALRELANHTARKAITLNTHKRMTNDFYTKLMISAAGFIGGTIVLAVNGLTPNVAMAGMICAYAVFLLWGYDAWCHSRRLVAAKKEDEVEDE